MVEDVLYHIRLGKHYWRSAPFAEMAELYMSRFLRMVSQGMVSLFVVVFLYQKGYSVISILLLIGVYFAVRVPLNLLLAYYVGWVGPKRTVLVSNILMIPSYWALVLVDHYTLLSVIAYLVFQGLSQSLYSIASDVQFSSIRHQQSFGKEFGWLYIAEKIGTGLAPLVGGLVAYAFGPETVMWIAALLSLVSAAPLFLSPDKIHRKQKVLFHGLPFRLYYKQLTSNSLSGVDYLATSILWPLFTAITIFGTTSNVVYAALGAAFSVSLVTSVICSRIYGVLIDRRRSRELFEVGVVVNALIHVVRPFVTTPIGVGTTNAANEVGTTAYNMPYVQGTYDVADNLPGYRIAYLACMQSTMSAGAAIMSFIAATLVWAFGFAGGMTYAFFVASILVLMLFFNGFASLRR